MAMRDPGPPGRNPFFDHGPEAELNDDAAFADEVRDTGFDPADWGLTDDEAPRSWPGGGGGADAIGSLTALVDALQGAQPEATEHLVAAAHELVLAVKTVVDATEAVLAAQRASMSPRPAAEATDATSADDPFATPESPTSPPSGVRRIDLA